MHARSPKLLEDIRDAAAFVGKVTRGRTLAQYSADRLLRQAVERNFEIIGEAVKRLAQVDPACAEGIAQYPQIIAFRNILTKATTSWTMRWCGAPCRRNCPRCCGMCRHCWRSAREGRPAAIASAARRCVSEGD